MTILDHGNHSGERLLFVGCIVNFFVSYLICTFQDSVPAGSYNDPFLVCVCVCVCHKDAPGSHRCWDATFLHQSLKEKSSRFFIGLE